MTELSKELWEQACRMRSMSIEAGVESRRNKAESFIYLKKMHKLFAEYYRTVLENKCEWDLETEI